MRERSESRERNDDWNRDDDDRMRERNEEEKIPVWTRRRPTGFDVMPEGERSLFLALCALIVGLFLISLSRIVSFGFALFTTFGGFVFSSFLFHHICARYALNATLSLSLLI